MIHIVGSSNGRTTDFDSVNLGSSPSPTATLSALRGALKYNLMKEWYYKNEYVVLLGKLKSNLISLETILRFYLLKKEGDDQNFIDPSKANIGELVEKNAFTNYDMLSSLIEKYNSYQ